MESHFEYTFPFEGNWNSLSVLWYETGILFEYTFPFEGNWNISEAVSTPTAILLWIHFPVWRELKHLASAATLVAPSNFEYTFPFEGNWNKSAAGLKEVPATALNTLSRLKGIETLVRFPLHRVWLTLNTLSRLKGIETLIFFRVEQDEKIFEYTFPFEGNWNLLYL